jgi:hypothetical protein
MFRKVNLKTEFFSGRKIWTLPHLVDRKISMDYKQEGEADGKKGYRTAKLLESV